MHNGCVVDICCVSGLIDCLKSTGGKTVTVVYVVVCCFQIILTVTAAETLMLKSVFRTSLLWQFVYGTAVRRKLSVSARASMFYEPNTHGEPRKETQYSYYEHWRDGIKLLPGEISKFKEEVFWKFRCDNLQGPEHNDYEVVWKFDNKEMVNSWLVTTDQDNNEGQSRAEFVTTPNNHGLFRGHIDTTVPKDGILKRTGYCNIRSPPNFVRSLLYLYLHSALTDFITNYS